MIAQVVQRNLMKLRDKTTSDKTLIFINRQIARYLNFFKKNRIATKTLLKNTSEELHDSICHRLNEFYIIFDSF